MIKYKKSLGIMLLIFSSSIYASFPQSIQLCLGLLSNGLGSPIRAKFVSSDLFDSGTSTNEVRPNTSVCVEHKYNYGPKNIRLTVEATEVGSLNDTAFFHDPSCNYMQRKKNGVSQSNYITTKDRRESWNLMLKQIEPRNGFKYSYLLSCEHKSF